MRLISRHILSSLAAPFVWGVLALTGLLLLNQLPRLIDTFGGRGLDFRVMIEAIVLALPALLTLTLPMSVLVATLYAYSTLAADLEIVALYANGVSVWRMVRPALLAAVIVTVVNFLLFDQIVPISNTRFRTLTQDVYRKTPTLTLRAGQLNELPPTGYVLRAREIAATGGGIRDVTIWDLRRYDGRRVIHADSGQMMQSPDGNDLLMTLYDGEVIDFSTREPTRVERTAFHVNVVKIADVQRDFERSQGQAERGDRERSGCELLDGITESEWTLDNARRQRETLTRRDLRHLVGLPPTPPPTALGRPEFTPHCGRWRKVQDFLEEVLLPSRLEAQDPPRPAAAQDSSSTAQDTTGKRRDTVRAGRDSLGPGDSAKPRARSLLRVPKKDSVGAFGVTLGQDSAPPGNDSAGAAQVPGLPAQGMQDTGFAAPLAPTPAETVATPSPFLVDPQLSIPGRTDGLLTSPVEVSSARLQAQDALRVVREYDVEYHKKFAIPLASFCFVLLGVALALKFPQSGIGLVIGGSLITFLALYVLLIGGESLADDGVISAELAMYGPVVVFTLFGLLAVASANREMGTARTAGIAEWFRNLFRRRINR